MREQHAMMSENGNTEEVKTTNKTIDKATQEASSRQQFLDKFADVCALHADELSLVYLLEDGSDWRVTYHDFFDIVTTQSAKLAPYDLQNLRVALVAETNIYSYMAFFVLTAAGATSVIIDAGLSNDEKDELMENGQVSCIVASPAVYESWGKEQLEKFPVFNVETFELFAEGAPVNRSMPLSETDDAVILFSSGTTSKKKGVVITYAGCLGSEEFALSPLYDLQIRCLLAFPIYHISGLASLIAMVFRGSEIGLLENFDASKLLPGFQRFKPNMFGMVPKVFEVFQYKIEESIRAKKHGELLMKVIHACGFLRKYFHINLGKVLFKSVNKQVFGGEMIYTLPGGGFSKPETARFFLSLGYGWINVYAATETSLWITCTTYKDNFPDDYTARIDFTPCVDVRILNPDKNGMGVVGVKSKALMRGYYNEEELTAAAFTEDGYFITGDTGYIKDNKLYLKGRDKESIHRLNGEKVSPDYIEGLYREVIPSNVKYACCGIKDAAMGYDKAAIFIEQAPDLDFEKIKRDIFDKSKTVHADDRVDIVELIDTIPYTSVGKTQRYKLAQMYEAQKADEKPSAAPLDKRSYMLNLFAQHAATQQVPSGTEYISADLGVDSLSIFTICVEIESKLGVSVLDILDHDVTVDGFIAEVERRAADAGGADGAGDTDGASGAAGAKGAGGANSAGSGTATGRAGKGTRAVAARCTYPEPKTAMSLFMLRRAMRACQKMYDYTVTGIEHLPETDKYILCPNHLSHLDGLWIISALPAHTAEQICCMAKKEHLDGVLSRRFLNMLGGIPVDREGNSTHALKNCLNALNNSECVMLIHPEGTRSADGQLGKFKSGASKLSVESGVPIVPVCIQGSYEIFPKHKALPRLRDWKGGKKLPLRISFGTPIYPESHTLEEITAETRQQIVDMGSRFGDSR